MRPPFKRVAGDSEKSRFAALLTNASMLVGGRTVTGLLSLVYLGLAARSLGIETFGVLTLINAYAQTIGSVAEFKSWQTVLHYGTRAYSQGRRDDLHRVVRFALRLDAIAAAGGTAVALAGAYVFARTLGWPEDAVPAGMLYATSVLFMSSGTANGVLRLVDRFDLIAVPDAVSGILRLAGALAGYLLGAGLEWFLFVWYISTFAGFALSAGSAIFVFRRGGHAAGFLGRGLTPLPREVDGVWRFVFNISLSSTLGIVTTRVATLAVGVVFGAEEAALFRIARQVSAAVARPARLLVPALYPELARLWADGAVTELRRLCLKMSVSAGSIATMAFLVLVFFGKPLIILFVGRQYVAAEPIMLWLFAASMIAIWGLPFEPLLVSTGRSTRALVVRAVASLSYLAALVPIMHRYGLNGVGAAAVGVAVLLLALQFVAVFWDGPRGSGRTGDTG